MLPDNRRVRLNHYIQLKGEVTIAELEEIFSDVSTMTIRRDLEFLEKSGEILRVRGGAVSVDYVSKQREEIYTRREYINLEGKSLIAQKALSYMQTGRSIFMDAGTTTMALAKLLPEQRFFVLTNGVNISLELSKNAGISINTIGGIVNKETLSVSGGDSIKLLQNINIDVAFMATSGYSIEDGFTNGYSSECDLKREAIRKAKKTIMLMDKTKLDHSMLFTFARPEDIDVLITDEPLPPEIAAGFEKYNVEIV